MTLLTLLVNRDGGEGAAESGDDCTYTYDVDVAYTNTVDEAWNYDVDEAYTYDPCADD